MNHISNFYSFAVYDLDLYHILSAFFIYSILGWIVESVYMSFCNHKLTNRGFIRGPICPIYGGAATVIYFLLLPLEGNYIAIYFVGVIVSTAIEYAVAQIMIYIFDEVWWDYNNKPFNYKGIICLESSIAWGFYCVMLFGFLEKACMRFVDFYTGKIGQRAGEVIVSFLMIYYMSAFMRTVIKHRKEIEKEDCSEIASSFAVEGPNEKITGKISKVINSIRK